MPRLPRPASVSWKRNCSNVSEPPLETYHVTSELARQVANWLKNTRWDRTARTLEAMAQCNG